MKEKIDYKRLNLKLARETLGGKNIVFTGRGFLVRGELIRLARQAGANVDNVVTKKCDILIVGEKPGSKLRKAKILGCDIITISDFKDILEGKSNKNIEEYEEDLLNIDFVNGENESINILRKNIVLIINNDVIKERTIKKIKLNGGNILNSIEEENIDILVYQPSSELSKIIEKARSLNVETITLGVFNKLLSNG